MNKQFAKIQRELLHLRLQPIRVFCFHQVSDTFDESFMKRVDWLQTDSFKNKIINLKEQGYIFISLPQAFEYLKNDIIRIKKYAVLTADDGWASLRNILPWLSEQQIPVTLFLNPAYLDGKHFRERDTEQYLKWSEVENLHEQYPLLTIGSHGWEHKEVLGQQITEFDESVIRSKKALSHLPNYIPFFAYPYGRHSICGNTTLKSNELVPVYVNGEMNYKNHHINRELLR